MREQQVCLMEGDALQNRALIPEPPRHPSPRPLVEVVAEIRGVPNGVFRFVLEGGRPAEHPEFDVVAAEVRAREPQKFALETDGGSLSDAEIERLQRAGVNELYVHVGGLSDAAHSRTLRSPGTAREALEGVLRACASGIPTYVVVTPVRDNVREMLELPRWLARIPERPKGLLFALPDLSLLARGGSARALPPGATAELAARLFDKCHYARLEYGFRSKRGLPPCAAGGVLDRFGTVFHDRHLFFKRDSEAGLTRVRACAACSLEGTCRGVEREYVDTYGEGTLRSVPLAVSMDWKLRELNSLDRREYRYVSPFRNSAGGTERGLLRINGHCNMSCAFCFVDRTAPDFDGAGLLREIDGMLGGGKEHVVISGGEPTLHPELPNLIRHARERGAKVVEIQTNGVRCADEDYASMLVDAGLTKATVSLHSADPEHSDKITRLPNAFPKTVAAIHNFRRLGVTTQVAHVITKSNYRELPSTIAFLGRTFPKQDAELSLCLAIAQGISDLVYAWVVPSFTEIRPYVHEALDRCLETGIGFGGMIGQGGYPPCMLGGELKYYENAYQHLYVSDDWTDQFYKAKRCAECSFDAHCLGVRRSYVECYGDAELVPFQASPERLPEARPSADRRPKPLVRLRLSRDAR